MRRFSFSTVDVFTATRFGGNQLAVFTDAAGLSDAEMQSLAAEMNLSETSFVLPPDDSANTARVRIFNRTAEMPFAGHPNVGTGFVLARLGRVPGGVARFEEIAGLVEVRIGHGEDGEAASAEIGAPQPLQILGELPAHDIAACIGLAPERMVTAAHPPLLATVGVDFVIAQVAEDALSDAAPDLPAFRRAAARSGQQDRLSIFVYSRSDGGVRARMFAPLSGTWEDPATGSANATLGALLLSLAGEESLSYEAVQGVEMGRPSHLRVSARRTADGIRASVGGTCVPVFEGKVRL